MKASPHYQPLIIIGAPRSGTNLLRDLLVSLPGFATWPCDEINPIWRYGNVRHPSDELLPVHITDGIRRYIRGCFDKVAQQNGASYVVEKTCANALRIPFVNALFPEAKFIRIIRDGRDAIASMTKRWQARIDWKYTLRKARFVPLPDLPTYAWQFCVNRLNRTFLKERRLKTWGPRFEGIDDCLKRYPLLEVCSMQWRKCVEKAEMDLGQLEPWRVFRLRYEDLVVTPDEILKRLSEFLGVEGGGAFFRKKIPRIRRDRMGLWKQEWTESDLQRVLALIGETLVRHHYTDVVTLGNGAETNVSSL